MLSSERIMSACLLMVEVYNDKIMSTRLLVVVVPVVVAYSTDLMATRSSVCPYVHKSLCLFVHPLSTLISFEMNKMASSISTSS